MTTAEALRAGLDRIRTVGWRQGTNRGDGKSACALESLPLHLESRVVRGAAAETLRRVVGITDSLATWNDAPGRTQAEVEAVYERAIDLAEAEEGKP